MRIRARTGAHFLKTIAGIPSTLEALFALSILHKKVAIKNYSTTGKLSLIEFSKD